MAGFIYIGTAQEQPQEQQQEEWRSWPLSDRFLARVDLFFPNLDTKIRVDASDGSIGTTIDFEQNLGMSDTETLGGIGFGWRFAKKHRLRLDHFNLDRSGSAITITEIRFGEDVDRAELQPGAPDDQYVNVTPSVPMGEPAPLSQKPRWQPAQLPPGFQLSSHNHENRENGQVFEHMVYSDGLASVSVYIETIDEEQDPMPGLSRIGALNAYVRQRNDLQITAIGEVPELTVKTIAETVQKAVNGD